MCIVAAKYFDNIGWVGVKNRDRNYVPDVSFLMLDKTTPKRLLFYDDMTGYMEGLNSQGIGVLSASLQVLDDEKEIKKRTRDDNPDGERIRHALMQRDIEAVVIELAKAGMTGNTIIFDQERCFLLEACLLDGEYRYDVEEIYRDEIVVRTNHGILLPWAGYQRGRDSRQDLSRASSEARYQQAHQVTLEARTPQELIDGLAKHPNENTQMNMLRTTTDSKKMRTTAQEMIIPLEKTFFLRPVQSKLDIDFWRINQDNVDLWLEILSNRTLNHPQNQTLL